VPSARQRTATLSSAATTARWRSGLPESTPRARTGSRATAEP
jgi:hypothetical protein